MIYLDKGYILCGEVMAQLKHKTLPSPNNDGRVVLICHFVDATILRKQILSFTTLP
jgi:hypothetical protein